MAPERLESPETWTRQDCETALYGLLQSTLKLESLTALRDTEVAKVHRQYSGRLVKHSDSCALLEHQIEAYYRANRATLDLAGQKSVQMAHGLVGMRAPTNPALVPISDKWSWSAITKKVAATWKKRFLLPPKPQVDKVKLKKLLTEDELKACGMKLETAETFYVELNRLTEAKEAA